MFLRSIPVEACTYSSIQKLEDSFTVLGSIEDHKDRSLFFCPYTIFLSLNFSRIINISRFPKGRKIHSGYVSESCLRRSWWQGSLGFFSLNLYEWWRKLYSIIYYYHLHSLTWKLSTLYFLVYLAYKQHIINPWNFSFSTHFNPLFV